MKQGLKGTFKMKDLGEILKYLGIDVVYNPKNKTMTLSQSEYISLLAEKYYGTDSNKINTPLETKLKLKSDKIKPETNIKFRNLIGALLYTCEQKKKCRFLFYQKN